MPSRLEVLIWILLGGAFLAGSRVAETSRLRGLLLLAALVCLGMMFVRAA
jgi:hypothetical protein